MPRQKRPSMKGRGAEIFFAGDAESEASTAVDPVLAADLDHLPDDDLLIFEEALEMLKRPADQQIGPRLAAEELETISDLVYEARKSYGVKLTQQDIVRLGVVWMIASYRERQATSVLGLFIRSRKEQEVLVDL